MEVQKPKPLFSKSEEEEPEFVTAPNLPTFFSFRGGTLEVVEPEYVPPVPGQVAKRKCLRSLDDLMKEFDCFVKRTGSYLEVSLGLGAGAKYFSDFQAQHQAGFRHIGTEKPREL